MTKTPARKPKVLHVCISCLILINASTSHCGFSVSASTGDPTGSSNDPEATIDRHSSFSRAKALQEGGSIDYDRDGIPDFEVIRDHKGRLIRSYENGTLQYESIEIFNESDHTRTDRNLDGIFDMEQEILIKDDKYLITTKLDNNYDGHFETIQEDFSDIKNNRRYIGERHVDLDGKETRTKGYFIDSVGDNACSDWKAPPRLDPCLGKKWNKENQLKEPKAPKVVTIRNPRSASSDAQGVFTFHIDQFISTKDFPRELSWICTQDEADVIAAALERMVTKSLRCMSQINKNILTTLEKKITQSTITIDCGERCTPSSRDQLLGYTWPKKNRISINPFYLNQEDVDTYLDELILHEFIHIADISHKSRFNDGGNWEDGEPREKAEGGYVDIPNACGAFCGTCGGGPIAQFCLGTHDKATREERNAAACSRCSSPDSRNRHCGSKPFFNSSIDVEVKEEQSEIPNPDGTFTRETFTTKTDTPIMYSWSEKQSPASMQCELAFSLNKSYEQSPDLTEEQRKIISKLPPDYVLGDLLCHHTVPNAPGPDLTVPDPCVTAAFYQTVSCDDRYLDQYGPLKFLRGLQCIDSCGANKASSGTLCTDPGRSITKKDKSINTCQSNNLAATCKSRRKDG